MIHDILFAFWFLLPAAYGNVAPILSNVIPGVNRWKTPIDFGRKFQGREIFGSHKTWRGIVSGMILATLVLWLEQLLVRQTGWAHTLVAGRADYLSFPTLILGPLFGLGALGGDAIESFFKRRRGIKSGETWLIFDQIDYIIGGILVSLPFVVLPFRLYVYTLLLWFLMHFLASYLGWLIHLKDSPI